DGDAGNVAEAVAPGAEDGGNVRREGHGVDAPETEDRVEPAATGFRATAAIGDDGKGGPGGLAHGQIDEAIGGAFHGVWIDGARGDVGGEDLDTDGGAEEVGHVEGDDGAGALGGNGLVVF